MMKLWTYENHIWELRDEELNGRGSPVGKSTSLQKWAIIVDKSWLVLAVFWFSTLFAGNVNCMGFCFLAWIVLILTLKTDDFKSGTKTDVNRHGAANRLKLARRKYLVNKKIKASGKKKGTKRCKQYKRTMEISKAHGLLKSTIVLNFLHVFFIPSFNDLSGIFFFWGGGGCQFDGSFYCLIFDKYFLDTAPLHWRNNVLLLLLFKSNLFGRARGGGLL